MRREQSPPRRLPLARTSVISVTDSFAPSGVVGTARCEVILVGGAWGTVVRVNTDGRTDARVGRVPGAPRFASLQGTDSSGVVVWSHEPESWGVLDIDSLTVRGLPVPLHPWGARWVGPAVPLPLGRFAMAPTGDAALPRRQPVRWVSTPLVQIVDSNGRELDTVGHVGDHGGYYLSWLSSRLAVGSVGDTLLVLTLSDAMLSAYAPSAAMGESVLWKRQLPLYFRTRPPREEVRTIPWIQYGGDITKFVDVPHVASATFGPEGKLYAIRNYFAEWMPTRSAVLPTQGRWVVGEQGLEIYDAHGQLLGAYALPQAGVRWVSVDVRGRLFLRAATESLQVVEDPTFTGSRCKPMPEVVRIPHVDVPPNLP